MSSGPKGGLTKPGDLAGRTKAFRTKHRSGGRPMPVQTFLALMRQHGVSTANPMTLSRWESGATIPSVASALMWTEGMRLAEDALKRARRDDSLRRARGR